MMRNSALTISHKRKKQFNDVYANEWKRKFENSVYVCISRAFIEDVCSFFYWIKTDVCR